MDTLSICNLDYQEFLIQMEEFHGYRSPGILLGGMMLDTALQNMGTTPYLNVVSETVVCLPDAIQLLTPCTFGNGFLQVLDWGKFALTAYERQSLAGVRVWLDYDQIIRYQLIRDWFERTGNRKEKPPFDELSSEIISAAEDIIVQCPVKLFRALKDATPVPTGQCPVCKESYPLKLGKKCPACSGNAYYNLLSD